VLGNWRKYGNPVLEIDRFARYNRVLRRHTGRSFDPAEFRDRVVLELGCGPVLGILPLAVFYGATAAYYSEPSLSMGLIKGELLRERYFRRLHAELVAAHEPARDDFLEFDGFYEALLEISADLSGAPTDSRLGFVYSNSVLEHIPQNVLPGLLEEVRKRSGADCEFLHAVDFSDHRRGKSSFANIYRHQPPVARSALSINFCRPSEIRAALEDASFAPEVIPYRTYEGDLGEVHPDWTKFSDEELRIGVAFFVSRRTTAGRDVG
jgi:hypothetical protein